jgi:RNA polymerase sigma factor (sigma-70 family)
MRFRVVMRTQADGRLVELVHAGHEGAFDEIVRRYREPLARYCRRLVGVERADEAVQQAFVDAWSSLSRDGQVRELRPWLYRVAFHATIRPAAERADLQLPEDHEGANGRDDADSRIETRAVLAAVAALPERQREAIVLTMRGFGSDEVGRSLGLSDGAARQLVHRARAALRAGATAITPWQLVVRMFQSEGADVIAGAGSTGLAAAALKVSATVLVGTAALGGGAVVVQDARSNTPPGKVAPAAAHQPATLRLAALIGTQQPGGTPAQPATDAGRGATRRKHRRRGEGAAPGDRGSTHPTAGDPAAEDPPANDAAADDPPPDDAAAEDPPPDDPPADDPPPDDPPADDPPPDDPPPDDPSAPAPDLVP